MIVFLCALVALILFVVAAFEGPMRHGRGPVAWGWLGLAVLTLATVIATWP